MNGELVKQWLKKNNVRPEELAVRVGISMSTMNKIFAGHAPSKPIIIALAAIMGFEEAELCPSARNQFPRRDSVSG